MNLLYGGRLGCFSPVSHLTRKNITLIRPLIFCEESKVVSASKRYHLPVIESDCPVDGHTCRQHTQDLVEELEKSYPEFTAKVMGAMQRADIDGWGKPLLDDEL